MIRQRHSITDIIKILQASKLRALTTADLKKLLDISNNNTANITANKLVKNKILLPLKKGLYASILYPPEDFEVANLLYPPSYVSLESALSLYGMLSQFPYVITSVSPKKTKRFLAQDKEYEYIQIKKEYFMGFIKKGPFLIASPEKALVDLLYLASKGLRHIDIKELDLSKINKRELVSSIKTINHLPFQKLCKELGLC
jgi:predicted transcriptional regulator of viral defense system